MLVTRSDTRGISPPNRVNPMLQLCMAASSRSDTRGMVHLCMAASSRSKTRGISPIKVHPIVQFCMSASSKSDTRSISPTTGGIERC